jgi:hypothetical protein
MSIGFYELLQVAPDAAPDAVRAAYQEQVAQVVRKLRAAEARQQDVAAIEARRSALGEAWAVLSDPVRRRRYNRYRELARGTLPTDPEELWAQAGASLVDPAAAAALHVLRTLTDLRVGEPVFDAPVDEPEVSGVHRIPDGHRGDAHRGDPARAEPSRGESPRPEPVARLSPDASNATIVLPPPTRADPAPRADGPPPLVLPPPSLAVGTPVIPRRATDNRTPPASGLAIDRAVPVEDLARLLDQYGPTGAFLRAARELRRTTLPQLSATTRVSLRFLDAMERDAYTDLPGATFVRGYLKMVVRSLEAIAPGPEAEEFIEGYMSRYFRARG